MDAANGWNVLGQITGLGQLTAGQFAMMAIGFALICLGLTKKWEPLALVALGLGAILANLPAVWLAPSSTMGGPLAGLLRYGIDSGFLAMLVLVGIGAWIDFGALLAAPVASGIAIAAQFGIFFTLIGALVLAGSMGFPIDLKDAASIGLIAAADGPIAIFSAARLSPRLVGSVALATYVYIAFLPFILPSVMRLLTNASERKIRMSLPVQPVSPRAGMILPLLALGLAVVFLPAAAPLLAALAFGNLLRQIPATATFIKNYRGGLIRIATLLLGLAAGSRLTSELFFVPETLLIFVLGLTAACVGSASAILYAKLLNRFRHATDHVNPLIGAAAIGALGVSARLADFVARQEDADNSILAHATSASIAGLLGAVVTAGLLLALVPLLG